MICGDGREGCIPVGNHGYDIQKGPAHQRQWSFVINHNQETEKKELHGKWQLRSWTVLQAEMAAQMRGLKGGRRRSSTLGHRPAVVTACREEAGRPATTPAVEAEEPWPHAGNSRGSENGHMTADGTHLLEKGFQPLVRAREAEKVPSVLLVQVVALRGTATRGTREHGTHAARCAETRRPPSATQS